MYRGEWNTIRDKAYAKDPSKVNGTSVFGKYLAKMRLKQWKDKSWADSEALAAAEEQKVAAETALLEERSKLVELQYENGEISESEYRTLTTTISQNQKEIRKKIDGINNITEDDYENFDIAASLTEEDKQYLLMKWGKLYKPSEWIELEKTYNEMTASFDIQDADTTNTLILICKTNLKMNQSLDQGDIEGFQKLSKVSESLRKSAKFTAAQNKEEKGNYVDCVGELVAMCEKEGFIPRYVTDIPQDKVDLTLKDMKDYLYKLVTQDLGFGQQIEDALKKIQLQKESAAADILINDDTEFVLEDSDYEEFYDAIEEQKRIDRGDN